ncbi:RICIN domain-containing protein [Streptomyces sp. NPDC058953]|uniref:RICIN domain-containing protein n=1 Tax=unclassified Streptomyces TaxID=2593676 RepID=UPI0036938954
MSVRNTWLAGFGMSAAVAALVAVPAASPAGAAMSEQAAPPQLRQLSLRLAHNAGQLAEVQGASVDNGAGIVQAAASFSGSARWTAEDMGGGYVRFANVNSGKCLEVKFGDTADDAEVDQWTCDTGNHQQWRFVAKGIGYQLVARHSGKCLNVGSGVGEGNRLVQWPCSSQGWDNDLWLPAWEPATV